MYENRYTEAAQEPLEVKENCDDDESSSGSSSLDTVDSTLSETKTKVGRATMKILDL